MSDSSWFSASAAVALAVSLGALYLLAGRTKRRPTQHDLDPTLKKNQIRIATQKKAFRREDLPPEYLASLQQRRDIVELPMGAPRPDPPSISITPVPEKDNAWLPDHLQSSGRGKEKEKKKQKKTVQQS